jgi:hypothetical protein
VPTNPASPSASQAAPIARPATSASEAASTQRRSGEAVYNSMPTPSFVRPTATVASAAPAPAPAPTEIVTAPQRHTLAAGKYEAKPFEIWLVVLAGALFALVYALVRVRVANRRRRQATESLTAVLRRPAGQPTR